MKKQKYANPRYPHTVKITRVTVSNPFEDDDTETILYNGAGRVFTDTTTIGDSDMDYNHRKCSVPVRYDELSMEILDGDSISVTVGNIEYNGIVKDIEPDNNRTIIYWNRYRITD